MLQNRNIASAIIGASWPDPVASNVKAAGVTIEAEILTKINDSIGSLAERDPALAKSPETREAQKSFE